VVTDGSHRPLLSDNGCRFARRAEVLFSRESRSERTDGRPFGNVRIDVPTIAAIAIGTG
jgi:type IV secretory pathway protease TraF